jgi:hypothetical protein
MVNVLLITAELKYVFISGKIDQVATGLNL